VLTLVDRRKLDLGLYIRKKIKDKPPSKEDHKLSTEEEIHCLCSGGKCIVSPFLFVKKYKKKLGFMFVPA
jgi:hypothetical protein